MSNKQGTPQGLTKKRNRVPLSCESCRTRKLKCDRQKPCQNCTTRGLQSTCAFAHGVRQKHSSHGAQSEDMRSRLMRLESLVSSMAQTSPPPAYLQTPESTNDGKIPEIAESKAPAADLDTRAASLVKNGQGQHFVGASHWEAVLQDLAVIREHFEEIPEPQNPLTVEPSNPALLSGITGDVSLSDLMGDLPRRELSDRLVYRFFDTYDPAVPSRQLLHKPAFMKTYGSFWARTDQASAETLSKLFSVFCLAMESYDRQEDEPTDLRGMTMELSEMYRKRAAQCLLKSGISTATREHLEAFLLYGISEYAKAGNEAIISQWLILGMMVRKAFHMGYHRDPDLFPGISPYEKEIRRRLWAHVWQIDTLYSFSLGLPSSVSTSKFNVAPPRNLFEEELFEDMVALPEGHPREVMTPISFTCAKTNLMHGLSAVVEHLNSVEDHTYSQVVEMNKQLASALEEIPSFLRIKSWEESAADPKSLRLQRLQLRMFYDKAACTLNRRFLNSRAEKGDDEHVPRKLCIESALSLLRIQVGYHRERNKWIRFHLTRHDFLLAAVILFLVLGNKGRCRTSRTKQGNNHADAYDEEDLGLIRTLHQSREIWAEHTGQSADARTACRMFDRMMDSFQLPSADIQMGMPVYAPRSSYNEDTVMSSGEVQADMGSMTPGTDNIALASEQYADFDWNAWETAFENSNTNDGLVDLSAFWTFANTSAP